MLVKVCRTSSRDPEQLARFEREASQLASLNYPKMAAIHGLMNTKGTPHRKKLIKTDPDTHFTQEI